MTHATTTRPLHLVPQMGQVGRATPVCRRLALPAWSSWTPWPERHSKISRCRFNGRKEYTRPLASRGGGASPASKMENFVFPLASGPCACPLGTRPGRLEVGGWIRLLGCLAIPSFNSSHCPLHHLRSRWDST